MIIGRINKDVKGSGQLDGGELFLKDADNSCTGEVMAGHTLTLSGPASGSTSVNLCNAGGPYYHVDNLPPGTYTLTTTVPGGWQATAATSLTVPVAKDRKSVV